MTITRENLAELFASDRKFITFAGTETYLLFVQKFELRDFCAFEVLSDDAAWERLEKEMFIPILDTAAASGMGVLTDILVWRAAKDAMKALGYELSDVERFNELGARRVSKMVEDWRVARGVSEEDCPVVLAADLGPRGDGYSVSGDGPSVDEARDYYGLQLRSLAKTPVQLVVGLTMTNLNEAVGLVLAAGEAGLPVVVSPTIETDGRLPDGSELGSFFAAVEEQTAGAPLFYMVNCAHPTHLEKALASDESRASPWFKKFSGFRANASCKSHEELDNSTELDRGDPDDLSARMSRLADTYGLKVIGGCCGTDAEHMRKIADKAALPI